MRIISSEVVLIENLFHLYALVRLPRCKDNKQFFCRLLLLFTIKCNLIVASNKHLIISILQMERERDKQNDEEKIMEMESTLFTRKSNKILLFYGFYRILNDRDIISIIIGENNKFKINSSIVSN